MNKEHQYIEECLNRIGNKFSWGDFKDWNTHNFEALSFDIYKETGITISSRTLQRLVTRKVKYNPQTGTKNALAKYLGYANWEEFFVSKSNSSDIGKKKPGRINKYILNYFWLIQFIILFGLSSFFIFFYPSIKAGLNKSKIVFQTDDITGTAPHKASFFYDVSKIKTNNVYIDYNYFGKGELNMVKKHMHTYSKTFHLPDYYVVKMIAGGENMASIGVHVVTEGWETIVNNRLFQDINNNNDFGYLHVIKDALADLNINTDSIIRIDYRNIRDFGIAGDAMILETRFMNNASLGGQGCYDSKIEIINANGRLSFSFVTPGCDEKLLEAKFGDVYLSGQLNDLTTFFQDISYWRVLKITTGKKKVNVYLDDVQIYSVYYHEPLEAMKGISISFLGLGAVDYVKVKNPEDEIIYQDEFNIKDVSF